MRKVLVLGYIPLSKGGKQDTGLATGLFDLHDFVNRSKKYDVTIAATDMNKNTRIDNTTIIGWNFFILIKHILFNPLKALSFLKYTFDNRIYNKLIRSHKLFLKLMFFDYCIKKTEPEIIHFHGTYGAIISNGLINIYTPRVLRIHGINGYDKSIPNSLLHRSLERKVAKMNFSAITFVTEAIKNEWILKYGNKTQISKSVLNGYNSNIFYPNIRSNLKKQYDLITFSGISERKGQIRVINSIIKLKSYGIDLSYLIIGRGDKDYEEHLKKIVKENNLNVCFIDYLSQEEILKYLHASKYFILPSTTEGFGKVFIESIASGIPVIIPKDLPLSKEKDILNKENSFFLNSYKSDDISKVLIKIFSENKDIHSKKISESVKFLDWYLLSRSYIDIYDEISQ